MDLYELKKSHVRGALGITAEFGRIGSFVDFGNVNYWFAEDRQSPDGSALPDGRRLVIDVAKLKEFADLFSDDVRFYYGHDAANPKSLGFIQALREIYGKHRVFTKPMQKIRHHLNDVESVANTRETHQDREGTYICIPKCNFDVEIAVDTIKLADRYDAICLFSSDADFVHLARYLKSKGKKVILIKGGHVVWQLKAVADLVVSAQAIKQYIAVIKQKPGG